MCIHHFVCAVVFNVRIDGIESGFSSLKGLEMLDQKLHIKVRGMIIIDAGQHLGEFPVRAFIVTIVTNAGNCVAEMFLEMESQGGFPEPAPPAIPMRIVCRSSTTSPICVAPIIGRTCSKRQETCEFPENSTQQT